MAGVGEELRQNLGRVTEMNEFVSFIMTAENPDETITKVSNKLVDELLTKVKPFLAKAFIRAISAKVKIRRVWPGRENLHRRLEGQHQISSSVRRDCPPCRWR